MKRKRRNGKWECTKILGEVVICVIGYPNHRQYKRDRHDDEDVCAHATAIGRAFARREQCDQLINHTRTPHGELVNRSTVRTVCTTTDAYSETAPVFLAGQPRAIRVIIYRSSRRACIYHPIARPRNFGDHLFSDSQSDVRTRRLGPARSSKVLASFSRRPLARGPSRFRG